MTDQPSLIPLTSLLHTVLKKKIKNFQNEGGGLPYETAVRHTSGKKSNIHYINLSFLALLAA